MKGQAMKRDTVVGNGVTGVHFEYNGIVVTVVPWLGEDAPQKQGAIAYVIRAKREGFYWATWAYGFQDALTLAMSRVRAIDEEMASERARLRPGAR